MSVDARRCPRCGGALTAVVFRAQNPDLRYRYCLPAHGGCGYGKRARAAEPWQPKLPGFGIGR